MPSRKEEDDPDRYDPSSDRSSRANPSRDDDERFMRDALQLAQQGAGFVEPNPMVGCVLVREGRVIGSGYHRRFGGPHAEVDAIGSLSSPTQARGSTAYVTLEPCCHHGKTPPCSQALIDVGISRVVVAMADPFPRVNGGGLRQLNDAGIDTSVGVLCEEAEALNAPYLKRVRTGRPWVIAKWAMTIDGRIATSAGESQWITGAASRAEVHRLRSRVDAVVVGMGTVENDDPLLTARLADTDAIPPRTATRVVFCRHRLPAIESQLVRSASDAPLMLVVGPHVDSRQLAKLRSAGATTFEASKDDPIAMIPTVLDQCGQSGMTNVMLEGGAELLASFFTASEIDECHVYIGAKAFGGQDAKGPVGGVGVQHVADAWPLQMISVDRFEDDVRLVYRKTMD